MKPFHDLENVPSIAARLTQAAAARAPDATLVSHADLRRLKALARLHGRGLPPYVSWPDLLQEAFTRVLDGSRRQPPNVPMVAFLAEVMRSIREQIWRQHRRRTRQHQKLSAEFQAADFRQGELPDPTPSPERRAMAAQQMKAIDSLFEQDLPAQQIISALYEGLIPEETCATHSMSRTAYDSTRKRIRRALIRAGLRPLRP